ncbi:MAG: hypothetical protein Greene041662_739 [Candidatus Peregrinibacteria bacterium Greene0416_62]|nr:MAG: hypothetical protein Greene041662_739 [Candidatus Peregrinibacteria bacterium Greene0416_62]TSC98750.1 MAG: hypothetical protein Greene101449_853 [Candidatus Peregrinibacteria bacterium Greene1014_49]
MVYYSVLCYNHNCMTEHDQQPETPDNAHNPRLRAAARQRELQGGDDELCGPGEEFNVTDALHAVLQASDMTEDIAKGRLLLTVLNQDLIEETIERYQRERKQGHVPGQRTVQIVLLERVLSGLSTTRADVCFIAKTENEQRGIAAVNEHRCYDDDVRIFISRRWIGIKKPDAAEKKE